MHSVRKRTPNPFPRVRQQRRALGLPLPAEGAEECVPAFGHAARTCKQLLFSLSLATLSRKLVLYRALIV